MKKLLSSSLLVILFLGVVAFTKPASVYAAATLFLSPASGSFNRGSEFWVAVRENSGTDPVNAVQANLTYDPAKLEFIRFDIAGTAFPGEMPPPAAPTGGGGSVNIPRFSLGSVTGDQLVANVVFKGIADGATSVTFASGSELDYLGAELLPLTKAGGAYTISAPPTPVPTPDIKANGFNGPITIGVNTEASLSWAAVANAASCTAQGDWSGNKSVSGGKESTGKLTAIKTYTYKLSCTGSGGTREDAVQVNVSSTSTPTPTPSTPTTPTGPDKTAPKITNIKTTTSLASTVIEWTTDEPATSLVEYGLSAKYILVAESAGLTKDHKVSLNPKTLIPGTTFHFRVRSVDSAGNIVTGQDVTFRVGGYTVKIKVIDLKGKGVKGVKVNLSSETLTAKTDKAGIATFKDVASGKHQVTVESGLRPQSSSILVKEINGPQSFEVRVSGMNIPTDWLKYGLIFLIGLLAAISFGLGGWWWTKKRDSGGKEDSSAGPDNKKPSPAPAPAPVKSQHFVKFEKSPLPTTSQKPKISPSTPAIQPKGESKMEIFRAEGSK